MREDAHPRPRPRVPGRPDLREPRYLAQAARAYGADRGAGRRLCLDPHPRRRRRRAARHDWAAARSVVAPAAPTVRGTLSTELGRPPTVAEGRRGARHGAGPLKAHRDDVSRASVLSLQGFDDSTIDGVLPVRETPADVLEHRERLAYLRDAVERLPKRLQAVVEGYFFAERPMAELAAELGVTESPDLPAAGRARSRC